MMKRLVCSMLILLCPLAPLYAAGIFGMGISAGMSGDGGSLGDLARDINLEMHTAGGTIEDIQTTYLPVVSIEFLYSYQSVMIGMGWQYCTSVIMSPEGSIDGNNISFEYTRFSFPLTLGMAIPLHERARFYFAGGFNISYIVTQINQSSPGALASFPAEREYLFTGYVFGLHFKTGAEAVLSRNYSLFVEYTRVLRRAAKAKDQTDTVEITMGGSDFEITAGFRYNLDLSF